MLPPENSPARWEARVQRARTLAGQFPTAAQALTFFAGIAEFQAGLSASLPPPSPAGEVPFGHSLDLRHAVGQFPALLTLAERTGPLALAESSVVLAGAGADHWASLLTSYWESGGKAVDSAMETGLFFARALLQPYAAAQAAARGAPAGPPDSKLCLHCTARPVVGVLRKEAFGAKRSLVCSLCLCEWPYQRVLCPACGEGNFEALPVYSAPEMEHLRVDACDSCMTFIPTVDLTKNGLAIPDVDELAAVALTLWAQQAGYTKLQTNLLGM